MTYEYVCETETCKEFRVIKEIQKPIEEASKEEFCVSCGNKLKRIYSNFGLKTNDGYKK